MARAPARRASLSLLCALSFSFSFSPRHSHTHTPQQAGLLRADGRPRVIAFEAKDRVQRRRALPAKRPRAAELQEHAAWTGNVQVYDQSAHDELASSGAPDAGLWSWASCDDSHLFEVHEFRAHMALHNVFEGGAGSGGAVARATFDAAEERVRGELEACDRLRLVQSLVDMDSSWGGFAHEVLTYVSEECPSAVIATFGTDWAYPLADASGLSALFDGISSSSNRDRAKVEARRRINLGASLSLLSEVSTLLVPIAMASENSLPLSRFRHLRGLDRSSCAEMSTVAATAMEFALAAYRQPMSAYEIVAGVQPSMKVMELAASFPFDGNPEELLRRIANETEVSAAQQTEQDDVLEDQFSLLPAIPDAAAKRGRYEDEENEDDDEDTADRERVFYRRLHLHGTFSVSSPSSLNSTIDRIRSSSCVAQWTPSTLQLPSSYRISGLADCSIDAVSQLSTSSRVGRYLRHVARGVQSADKRVLFEFTRAGMSPDALEDMSATLDALGDAYFP